MLHRPTVVAQLPEANLFDQLEQLTPADFWALVERGEAGDAEAQLLVGLAYQHGYIAQPAPAEAAKWFRLAADQGLAQAQHVLGKMHLEGQGVDRDPNEAVKLIRVAAEQGFAEAQYDYGLMFLDGVGVPQDSPEAFNWFSRAAGQGSVGGQTYLGVMYVNGIGIPQNVSEGLLYLQQAARAGSPMAHANLGTMYANGLGVERDTTEALVRFFMAEAGGFAGVISLASEFTRAMSEGEVNELKRRANERYEQLLSPQGSGEVGAVAPQSTQPSLAEDPEASREAYVVIAEWVGANLSKAGTFTVQITDDWATARAINEADGRSRSVNATQRIRGASLRDCVLHYESYFLIVGSGVDVRTEWFIPLANVDVTSIRVQTYQLPYELRARTAKSEVHLRSRPGTDFVMVDSQQTPWSFLEHSIAIVGRKDADELATRLRTAVSLCRAM